MKEEKIVIDINSSGEINAETFGMQSASCLDELAMLMRDIATVVEVEKKSEFYQSKLISNNSVKVMR